jgi:predicted GIY-YIG superfamily endonuclease
MKWVYILKCENDYYYIGETTRLFRRFWEHEKGCGGLNTSLNKPETIVAIYKVSTLSEFFDYNYKVLDLPSVPEEYKEHALKQRTIALKNFNSSNDDAYENYECKQVENYITESLMIYNKDNLQKIRGGKYTRFDVSYKMPSSSNIYLPICFCGLPCDIKKNDNENYLFFRCAKKNMWSDFKDQFDIEDEPCKFYQEYTRDKELRNHEVKREEERRALLKTLFKKSFWLKDVELYNESKSYNNCIGGCNWATRTNTITFNGQRRNLCYDCFINKNEELSKKYAIDNSLCLIDLD